MKMKKNKKLRQDENVSDARLNPSMNLRTSLLNEWFRPLNGFGGWGGGQQSSRIPQGSPRILQVFDWDRRWIEIGLRIHQRLKNFLSIRNEVAEFIRVGFDSRNLKDPEESLGSQKDPEESSKISRTFKYSKVSSIFFRALQRIFQDLQGSLKKAFRILKNLKKILQNPQTFEKYRQDSSGHSKESFRVLKNLKKILQNPPTFEKYHQDFSERSKESFRVLQNPQESPKMPSKSCRILKHSKKYRQDSSGQTKK